MTCNIQSVELALSPSNTPSFLLDWELTMKCNLDCHYCSTGENGGHDNTTTHPPVNECLRTVDFMYEYVDLYVKSKPKNFNQVVLNIYGGEALHHPNFAEIAEYARQKYKDTYANWQLILTTTTNLIVSEKKLLKLINYIDQFTCSYHSGATDKQKELFRSNILMLQAKNKKPKCIILMPSNDTLFNDCLDMVEWCKKHEINFLVRQLDGWETMNHFYNDRQVIWLNNYYNTKSNSITDRGRACCGGRNLFVNQNYKKQLFYVPHKFTDWYCSVNHFFLFVKQVNGKIYVNKDCKMNYEGGVGPIGNLNDTKTLIDWTKRNLEEKTMPVIQCKKNHCHCGLCAPKSQTLDEYNMIMLKYKNEK